MKEMDKTYYFSDVQVRGYYSSKAKKFLEQSGILLNIRDGDDADLREGRVDYLGFSYYMSNVTASI